MLGGTVALNDIWNQLIWKGSLDIFISKPGFGCKVLVYIGSDILTLGLDEVIENIRDGIDVVVVGVIVVFFVVTASIIP